MVPVEEQINYNSEIRGSLVNSGELTTVLSASYMKLVMHLIVETVLEEAKPSPFSDSPPKVFLLSMYLELSINCFFIFIFFSFLSSVLYFTKLILLL